MNENSFNVCSRCGSANPLSARYCYQCGYELKSPEAPVVCTKCNASIGCQDSFDDGQDRPFRKGQRIIAEMGILSAG